MANLLPMDPPAEIAPRRLALLAAVGLLLIGVLAPFAQFGVLKALVVPGDAAATVANLAASSGLFRAGIAAFLVVLVLDIVLAWALYHLLSPVNRSVALLTAWLRVAFAAVFASSLVNLLDAALVVSAADAAALESPALQAQVMASVSSFSAGFTAIAHAIFAVCNFGLGYLLIRSPAFPTALGALLLVAGGGYLADAFGTILVPGYGLSIGSLTFVGEALLIVWLFARAIRGFPSGGGARRTREGASGLQPAAGG
jgi:hypothetical protein